MGEELVYPQQALWRTQLAENLACVSGGGWGVYFGRIFKAASIGGLIGVEYWGRGVLGVLWVESKERLAVYAHERMVVG